MGKDAAAIDVADEEDAGAAGRGGVERKLHVDDVGLSQVGFGRATRAFGDDDVELGAQRGERALNTGPDAGASDEVILGIEGARGSAVEHELGGAVALRLDQDGVHFNARCEPGGGGLLRLGRARSRVHRV